MVFHDDLAYTKITTEQNISSINSLTENEQRFLEICAQHQITSNSLIKLVEDKSRSLAVVGDAILHLSQLYTNWLSGEAPVPVVRQLFTESFLGGASIIAAHIASLNSKAYFVSNVGDDDAANTIITKLKQHSARTIVKNERNMITSHKTRYISGTHRLLRITDQTTQPIESNFIINTVVDRQDRELMDWSLLTLVVVNPCNCRITGRIMFSSQDPYIW